MLNSEKIISDANKIGKDMMKYMDTMKAHCEENGKEFDYDSVRFQYVWMKFAYLEDRLNRLTESIIKYIDIAEKS